MRAWLTVEPEDDDQIEVRLDPSPWLIDRVEQAIAGRAKELWPSGRSFRR